MFWLENILQSIRRISHIRHLERNGSVVPQKHVIAHMSWPRSIENGVTSALMAAMKNSLLRNVFFSNVDFSYLSFAQWQVTSITRTQLS